jgi:hypothetical protein
MVLNMKMGNRKVGQIENGENIVKWIKGQRISWLESPGENGGG